MSNPTSTRWRRSRALAIIAATSLVALAPDPAPAVPITWTGAGGPGTQWLDAGNWAGGSPGAANDATIGTGFASGTDIYVGSPSSINSITINTTTGFDVYANPLTLVTGNLTRLNVSGVEADQSLPELILGANGTFNIAGSNTVIVAGVGQPSGTTRSLTKTGVGTLALLGAYPDAYSGATNVNQGYLRLTNTGTVNLHTTTVAAAATLELNSPDVYSSPVTLPASTALRIGGTGAPVGVFFSDGALKNTTGYNSVNGTVTLLDDSSINVADGNLNLLGPISDGASTFGLTKFGTGDLVLSAPNSCKGATFITSGRLLVENPAALGTSGAITASSAGTLALDSNLSFPRPVFISGAGSNAQGALLAADGANATFAGQITLSADASVGANPNATLTVSGIITDALGTRALTKVGAGTLVLTANNTYTGGTTVAAGTLRLATAAVLPGAATVTSGATLELPGALNLNRTLNLNGAGTDATTGALHSLGSNSWSGPITLQSNASVGVDFSGTLTLAGPVSGSFTLTKNGAGHLALTNAANTFPTLNIASGILDLSNPAPIPAAATLAVTASGGAVELSGNTSFNRSLSLTGVGISSNGALHNSAGDNTWSGNVALPASASIGVDASTSLTLSGTLSGSAGLSKVGPGLLVLAGTGGPFSGTIDIAAGSLRLASSTALAGANTVIIPTDLSLELTSNISVPRPLLLGGTGPLNVPALHNLSGSNTLSGPITLANNTAVSVDAGSTLTLAGPVTDTINTFSLTKTGAGTLVLATSNSYDGPTLVTAGTLAVTSNSALGSPASNVALSNGAKLRFAASLSTNRTFDLGTGSLQADAGVTVTYSGATLNGGFLRGPGTHAIGPNASLNAVTALPGSVLSQSSPATLTNFTNSGSLLSSAPLTFDGGYNMAAGSITTSSSLTTSAFENLGSITLAPGATLTNSDNPLTSGGGSHISISNNAILNLAGQSLELNGALLANDGAVNGPVHVNYGATAKGAGTYNGPVTVADGGVFLANSPAPSALIVGSLDVSSPLAAADIQTSLVIDYTGPSPLASVRAAIRAAYDNGRWDHPGIGSSPAADPANHFLTAVAYADNATTNFPSFAGHTLDPTSLLLKYTYYGDANLDGQITPDDYALLDRSLAISRTDASWTDGDFNYDGIINGQDYLLIDTTLAQQQGGHLSPTFLSQRESQFGNDYVSALLAATPEPSTLLLPIGLGALVLRNRKTSRHTLNVTLVLTWRR